MYLKKVNVIKQSKEFLVKHRVEQVVLLQIIFLEMRSER